MSNWKGTKTQKGKKMKTEEIEERPAVVETTSGLDKINDLNDDCLIGIFKCLTIPERLIAESVCKRWERVCKLAWDETKSLHLLEHHRLELEKLGLFLHPDKLAVKLLERCGRYLDSLGSLRHPLSIAILPLIGKHCHNLTHLGLQFGYYDNESCKVFSQLKKLKSISICSIVGPLPTEMLEAMPTDNLEVIEFCCAEDFIFLPQVVCDVFGKLKNLKTLMLEFFMLDSNLMKVIGERKSLAYLSLEECEFEDSRVLDILNLTNLERLELNSADNGEFRDVDDRFLAKLSTHCQKIKILELIGCGDISDIGLSYLLKLKELRELKLNEARYSLTDEGLSKFHNLTKLECNSCEDVADDGIISLIRHATKLVHLDVTQTQVTEQLLVEANEITKDRTNGLKLKLVINSDVVDRWGQDATSPFLVVEAD